MKLTSIALIGLLMASPAFAQEDLPMFETPVTDCPTCRANGKMPNVGKEAKNVDSIRVVPALPSVDVSMGKVEDDSARPFVGKKMKYNNIEKNSKSVEAYSSDLSKPVDFSAERGKEIKITPAQVKKEEIKQEETSENKKVEIKQTNNKAKEIVKKAVQKKSDKLAHQAVINQQNIQALHQVEKFNIAELRLGMQPEDVIETAEDRGFELTDVAYGIPSFMVTDYERECRSSGLYQTRLIHECVRETARQNDVYYISQLVFKRSDSKEQIIVLFSSTLTDNKAFKIDYTSFGDNSLGTSYKDLLKKTNRRDIFWKYVFEKYGKPAQKENLFWGSTKGVYMKVFLQGNSLDGRIVLEDVTQKGVDYGEAEDMNKEKDINNPFNF